VLGWAAVIGVNAAGCSKDPSPTDTAATTEKDGDTPPSKDKGGDAKPSDDTKDAFFNKKDLEGWKGSPEYWRVEGGAIVGEIKAVEAKPGDKKGKGSSKVETYLYTARPYQDFELKLQAQLNGKGADSGIMFRAKVSDADKFLVKGPQYEILGAKWGYLLGATGKKAGGGGKKKDKGEKIEILKDAYNEVEIICKGKQVVFKVNGHTTVDEEVADLPAEGVIAFQLTSNQPMTVTFRSIQFTDLSKK
jgi:hypothetical protein